MAGIGDAKKDRSFFHPQVALISQETNMSRVAFWKWVAKGSFPEKRRTELNHERKTGAVRVLEWKRDQQNEHFR